MVEFILIFLMGWACFVKSQFLVPSEQSPSEEVFQYDRSYEYIINNLPTEWDQAIALCRELDGTLATLESDELRRFAAEAMSESSMNLDGLWVGLQKINDKFTWLGTNITVPGEEFNICGNDSAADDDCDSECWDTTNCGAFVRANHTQPCLVNLRCDANRGFICKRRKDNGTTHYGWIRIRNRLYKIFYEQLSYDKASKECINNDINARLAVVETYVDAQALGRFLLIGRPSLEKVWIGARWREDSSQYAFESEPIVLTNRTGTLRYPPWRRGVMSKLFGCLLLDRHLSNVTYFVESACDRLRSYMCYKVIDDNKPIDVCNVGDYDWRVYYSKRNWFQAYSECTGSAPTGRLPVVEKEDLKYFIYIMESSKRYLLHVWLGAFYSKGIWTWTYTNKSLPKVEKDGYPPWVVNKSYEEEVEKDNLCLNIDRENTLKSLFYGTLCGFPQAFVCQYDKGILCPNGTNSTTTTEGTVKTSTTTEWPESTSTINITTTNRTIKTPSTKQTTKTTTTKHLTTTQKTTTTTGTPKTKTTRKSKSTTTKVRPTTTAPTKRPTTTKWTAKSSATSKMTTPTTTKEGALMFSTTTEWPFLKKKTLTVSDFNHEINSRSSVTASKTLSSSGGEIS